MVSFHFLVLVNSHSLASQAREIIESSYLISANTDLHHSQHAAISPDSLLEGQDPQQDLLRLPFYLCLSHHLSLHPPGLHKQGRGNRKSILGHDIAERDCWSATS